MSVTKLTPQIVTHELICPAGKSRIELCDSELPGLYIEVRASAPGQGTYYLRYKGDAGKTCHKKIARTLDIDLAEARKRARQLKAEITLGVAPRKQVNASPNPAEPAVPTLRHFFENQYMPYVKPRKRSWLRDQQLYSRIDDALGNLPLNKISRQQIADLHTKLHKEGLAPASADHHVKLLKHLFNLAIDWGVVESNPARRIPLFNPDNRRENYLDAKQLESLMRVLQTDPNRSVCLIAHLLLSSGARVSEALTAKWSQIDRENRVWRIAAVNSKSKRVRSVPLNESALDVLAQVGTAGKFEHVFINTKTGKPYTTIAKVWVRLRKKAGLPQLRLHDLRHSYASFLVNSGRSLYEVQKVLGHSDSKVTERYAHLSTKTLQDAADSASAIIQRAMPVTA